MHKKEIIGLKPTFHGLDIYLNSKKIPEINKIISDRIDELTDF